jgi:hypothetical protein
LANKLSDRIAELEAKLIGAEHAKKEVVESQAEALRKLDEEAKRRAAAESLSARTAEIEAALSAAEAAAERLVAELEAKLAAAQASCDVQFKRNAELEERLDKLTLREAEARHKLDEEAKRRAAAEVLSAQAAELGADASAQLEALRIANNELAAQLEMHVARSQALGRANEALTERLEELRQAAALVGPKGDKAVQTDPPAPAVSVEDRQAFAQLRPVLGLEIAKEQTHGKGLHIIMVKPDGPAAGAGLATDEFLHSIREEGGLATLTSSAVFERVNRARACARTCVGVRARVCACAGVCVRVCVCVGVCVRACVSE